MSLELFNITNWREHPTQRQYRVFFFHSFEEGEFFESMLQKHEIWYEKSEDDTVDRKKVMFAIHNHDMKEARHFNNLTIGKYRKPFIANRMLRFVVVFIVLLFLVLGILGYINAGR